MGIWQAPHSRLIASMGTDHHGENMDKGQDHSAVGKAPPLPSHEEAAKL